MIWIEESKIVDKSRGSPTWEIGEIAKLPKPEAVENALVPKGFEIFDITGQVFEVTRA